MRANKLLDPFINPLPPSNAVGKQIKIRGSFQFSTRIVTKISRLCKPEM